jgi:hypothetical protein
VLVVVHLLSRKHVGGISADVCNVDHDGDADVFLKEKLLLVASQIILWKKNRP